jgi:hypothetical protein
VPHFKKYAMSFISELQNTPYTRQLNWEVKPDHVKDSSGIFGGYKTLRGKNGTPLSVVTTNYHHLENHLFERIMQYVCNQTNGAWSVGSVDAYSGGKKIVGYFRKQNGGKVRLDNGDTTILTAGIINTHDASSSLSFGESDKFISCTNASHRLQNRVNATHTGLYSRLEKFIKYVIKRLLTTSKTIEIYNQANKVKISDSLINQMIEETLLRSDRLGTLADVKKIEDEKKRSNILKRVDLLRGDIETEITQKGATLLGLYNGITRYTNHTMGSKPKFEALVGSSKANQINVMAFNKMYEMVK